MQVKSSWKSFEMMDIRSFSDDFLTIGDKSKHNAIMITLAEVMYRELRRPPEET